MSTVKLKKAFEDKKAGDVISLPFLVARKLVAEDAAEDVDKGPPESATKAAAPTGVPAADAAALVTANRRCKELEAENADLKSQVAALHADPKGKK